MLSGGSKFQKTEKTKYKKNEYDDRENYNSKQNKQKHHDKSFYRLKKQEDTEYGY